jgi:alpha-L-rhamnosidase
MNSSSSTVFSSSALSASAPLARRVLRDTDPFAVNDFRVFTEFGVWPAQWISLPNPPQHVVAAYRLAFTLDVARTFTVHVSADEQYQLFLNGERIGRGPERGDVEAWCFESYELNLPAGEHSLVARVFSQGHGAAYAQMSLQHGFLLCPEEEDLVSVLATGKAIWDVKQLQGCEFISALSAECTGLNVRMDGALYPWGHESGGGEGWSLAEVGVVGVGIGGQPHSLPYQQLTPAMLPPMIDEVREGFTARHVAATPAPTSEVAVRAADSLPEEVIQWQEMLSGKASLTIPPHTTRRIIIDLEEYYCAWPELVLSGGSGARVRVHWSEGLFQDLTTWHKGNRDEIEGKYFAVYGYKIHNLFEDGPGDEFLPDGGVGRCFSPLWWQAGRYVEIQIQTAAEPLTVDSFRLRETRYPLEAEGSFHSDNAQLESITPIMVRALQMCAHETYMDCPFYEQLMYVGDTRLEVLVTYVLTRDDRLPRKALRTFDISRVRNGLTQSRYPSRFLQIIPPFSLWWVAMCHDYALWRGDPEFTRSLLPGVRAVCDHFASLINSDGLLTAPTGWNFTDWVIGDGANQWDAAQWPGGIPPEGAFGISGVLNWHAAYVFKMASELESWFGEPEIASLQARRAQSLATAVDGAFWNEERGIYADDLAHSKWSEHAQCLALLSGFIPESKVARVGEGLLTNPDLARTTIYFSFYLFEAHRILGRIDALLDRLGDWQVLADNGLKTTIEQPEPTRSDCHAWGAHPLFHFYATLAGIRPVAPGFTKAEITPQLGSLQKLEARMPHPQGEIWVTVDGDAVEVTLPAGVERV